MKPIEYVDPESDETVCLYTGKRLSVLCAGSRRYYFDRGVRPMNVELGHSRAVNPNVYTQTPMEKAFGGQSVGKSYFLMELAPEWSKGFSASSQVIDFMERETCKCRVLGFTDHFKSAGTSD